MEMKRKFQEMVKRNELLKSADKVHLSLSVCVSFSLAHSPFSPSLSHQFSSVDLIDIALQQNSSGNFSYSLSEISAIPL